MSIINGVWHDAQMDPPKTRDQVLAIKQLKDGRREICIAYCIRDYSWTNPATGVVLTSDRWVCQGNNNIIYWMPLPKLPEGGARQEPDQDQALLHDCVNELCYKCGLYHESYAGACDGCRWKAVKEGFR